MWVVGGGGEVSASGKRWNVLQIEFYWNVFEIFRPTFPPFLAPTETPSPSHIGVATLLVLGHCWMQTRAGQSPSVAHSHSTDTHRQWPTTTTTSIQNGPENPHFPTMRGGEEEVEDGGMRPKTEPVKRTKGGAIASAPQRTEEEKETEARKRQQKAGQKVSKKPNLWQGCHPHCRCSPPHIDNGGARVAIVKLEATAFIYLREQVNKYRKQCDIRLLKLFTCKNLKLFQKPNNI